MRYILKVERRGYSPFACPLRIFLALLQQGASFMEIGDLLGHRSLESVGIYAKVDLPSLRAVADLDLGGCCELGMPSLPGSYASYWSTFLRPQLRS
jgi:hypothetical protein